MSLRAIRFLDYGASPEAWDLLEDVSNWRSAIHRSGWSLDTTPVCGCAACGGRSPSDPQAFIPPTSGVAANGLPIYNWDQAAAQLTRESNGWAGLGNPANITFAFRASMDGAMPSDTSGFSQFTAEQIAMTLEALALWSEVANITFTRVQGVDGYSNNATMLFANYSAGAEGASAFAYYPGSTSSGSAAGDVWVNISLDTNNSNLVEGEFGPHTMAHEIGHAIGISHPADYNALDDTDPSYPDSSVYWQDSRMYTVMSYFGSAGPGGSLGAFSSGPQFHDIAAAQLLYGANMTTRTGDTVYGFNSNTGHAHFTITVDEATPVFAIWDAGGNDTLDLSGYSSAVDIDLREGGFSSAGPGTNPAVNGGRAYGNISIAFGAIIENGIGGAGSDLITGNDVANTLSGLGGNDTLNGGEGADTMIGGLGNDTFYVDNAGDVVTENASEGTDTVRSTLASYTLSANVENLILETGALNGTGNALANTITGNSGNNILDGGAGADTMIGGNGDDTYVVDNAGDVTTETSALGGTDTVQSSVTRTLNANIENLILTGVAAINGFGNVLNNTITGNSAANQLNGFDGNDILDGGAGADNMFGGNGDDTYYVDHAGDQTTEVSALGGIDTVISSVSRNLTAHIENLTLTGSANLTASGNSLNNTLTGNSGNNILYGYDGNDILNGGAGADTMFGAAGNDYYVVDNAGDITVEGAAGPAGGIDTVESWISRNLNANFENLILMGSAANAYGNILDNALTGNAAANRLYGFDGADILDGGAGADQMFGGNGNDTYIVDNAGDVTSETSALGGIDTVISSVTRNLTANIENLTLTGSANINGAGNALNNIVIGNDGANTLYGLDGNDRLDGGLGADTLQGGLHADTYVFSTAIGGGNVDAIIGFSVADDTIELSNAVFTGLGAGALDANAFVIGAAAADADDRIIYNSATGQLFFDADGNGAGAAILFATLAPGLALTSADFIVGGG
ncbi:MAG: M10 family metallopeptidase C-terminal domain-containing protein [Hyphomonadaceae bacterium]